MERFRVRPHRGVPRRAGRRGSTTGEGSPHGDDVVARRARRARHALLGTAIALPVLALGFASAAALPVGIPTIAASSSAVGNCDGDGVPVYSYSIVYDTSDERYEVSAVKVKNIDADCADAEISVTLADSGGTAISSGGPVTISGTTASIPLDPRPASASVAESHIVIVGP